MIKCSLSELNTYIRRVVALNFSEPLWVRCELASVKHSRGHLYLELLEKDGTSDDIIAQAQAVLWGRRRQELEQKFVQEFSAMFTEGQAVHLLVRVDYHERYGLKLIVEDIDPEYTLGAMAWRRHQVVEQLRAAGDLGRNAKVPLPVVLQRLAVISAAGAAGWADFRHQLQENPPGYTFQVRLFEAAMQGLQAAPEVTAQLSAIQAQAHAFDAVCILRGGGSRLDLAAFDDLGLGRAVAACTLPVLVGIGHEVDRTVLDLVAHRSLKTPTALADFLVDRNRSFEENLAVEQQRMHRLAGYRLEDERRRLRQLRHMALLAGRTLWQQAHMRLSAWEEGLPRWAERTLRQAQLRLEEEERYLTAVDPETVLKRGYSLVYQDGRLVTAAAAVEPGTELDIRLAEGQIQATVKKSSHAPK